MKITQYQCNLCGIKDDSMNSVVQTSKSLGDVSVYILSVREESNDFHLCRSCINRLENTFKKIDGYSPAKSFDEQTPH